MNNNIQESIDNINIDESTIHNYVNQKHNYDTINIDDDNNIQYPSNLTIKQIYNDIHAIHNTYKSEFNKNSLFNINKITEQYNLLNQYKTTIEQEQSKKCQELYDALKQFDITDTHNDNNNVTITTDTNHTVNSNTNNTTNSIHSDIVSNVVQNNNIQTVVTTNDAYDLT